MNQLIYSVLGWSRDDTAINGVFYTRECTMMRDTFRIRKVQARRLPKTMQGARRQVSVYYTRLVLVER